MHVFDFVVVLVSFIYALALTHLLSRIGSLLLAERIKLSALGMLTAVNAVWTVFFCWLGLWSLNTMPVWDIASIMAQFAMAISLYFICIFAAPEAGETADPEAFFWAQHRRFYWAYIVANTIGIACNVIYLKSSDPSLFLKWNIASLPLYVPCILALTMRARWAQWVAGISLLLITGALIGPLEASLR
jgi:hypothetical protein